MRTGLFDILLHGTTAAETDDHTICTCGGSGLHISAYIRLLQEMDVWPLKMFDTTISNNIETLESIGDPVIPNVCARCKIRWHSKSTYRMHRKKKLNTYKNSEGLCIDCVRSSTTVTKRICRIKHSC